MTLPSSRISPDPSDSQLRLFSSPHSFSVGFRSEDRDSHGKRFILCSLTHFCVDFDVCFRLLSWWKIQTRPIIRFLTEAVRFWFFNLLVFDWIHDAMHLSKMFRTSSRKTGPQHKKWTWGTFLYLFVLNSSGGVAAKKLFFSVSSDHRSQCHLKFQSCLTTEFAGVCF